MSVDDAAPLLKGQPVNIPSAALDTVLTAETLGEELEAAVTSGIGLTLANVIKAFMGVGLLVLVALGVWLAIRGRLRQYYGRLAVAIVLMILFFDLATLAKVITFIEEIVRQIIDWIIGLV